MSNTTYNLHLKGFVGGADFDRNYVDFIHDKPINQRKMIDIVNFIRNNPEAFPEWHNSDTAKLFSPPIFVNKKEYKGCWF